VHSWIHLTGALKKGASRMCLVCYIWVHSWVQLTDALKKSASSFASRCIKNICIWMHATGAFFFVPHPCKRNGAISYWKNGCWYAVIYDRASTCLLRASYVQGPRGGV